MGSNVYGIPVTDETLKGMEYDGESITAVDRGRVALEMKNAEGKDVNARRFAENMLANCKEGIMCLFYNATGNTLTLVGVHQDDGKIDASPYPSIIQNGQWGVFLYSPYGADGCVGQLAYGGLNKEGNYHEWGIAWNQWKDTTNNYCRVDLRQGQYYSNSDQWESLYKLTLDEKKTFYREECYGCRNYASIGSGPNAVLEVIMTVA